MEFKVELTHFCIVANSPLEAIAKLKQLIQESPLVWNVSPEDDEAEERMKDEEFDGDMVSYAVEP